MSPDSGPRAAGDRSSASGVLVRRSTLSDVESLMAFDMTVVVRTRDDWIAAIDKTERGERVLLVAEVDGAIAAFGQAHHLDQHPIDHAPAGWYLTGVTVLPAYRRSGLAHLLTAARLAWIAERAREAWYFADAQNTASIRLHDEFAFVEVSRALTIHGVSFNGNGGVLLRCVSDPSAAPTRR